MNMKLVKVVRQKKKDADWKSYKDPVAVLKRDLEVFVKECKEAKKKIDKILDSGLYFQLLDSMDYFNRATILSRELGFELREAYSTVEYKDAADKLLDEYVLVDETRKNIMNSLKYAIDELRDLSPRINNLRKTHF